MKEVPSDSDMKIIFVFLIIGLNFAVVTAETKLSGKKILCSEFNPEYFSNVTCSIKLKDRYTQLYSDSYTLKPGVSISNLKVKYGSFYKYRTVFRRTGVDFQEEVCNVAKASVFLPLDLYKSNTNNSTRSLCPLMGTFKRDNMELPFEHLPPLIPTGEYRFDTAAYTTINGKEIFLVKVQNFFECIEIFKKSEK